MLGITQKNVLYVLGMRNSLVPCAARCFSQTTSRNTVVVERWWQVPLSKEGSPPRLMPRRHRVYRVVEDTKHAKQEKMELILTDTVARLGGRGDIVKVPKSVGRNKLLPQGLAVYPSPENFDMFAAEKKRLREGKPEDRIQTRTGLLTAQFLSTAKLTVPFHTSIEYSISKEIISRYFKSGLGVVVPTHAMKIPEEPIAGVGESWCEVSVNGLDTVRVPIEVVPADEFKPKWPKKRGQRSPDRPTTEGGSVGDPTS